MSDAISNATKLAEWRTDAETEFFGDITVFPNSKIDAAYISGYVRAMKKQASELDALKARIKELESKIAALRIDYKNMVNGYQTLLIDLAPHLQPDQIHMVTSRAGNWFVATPDGKYLIRHDPRDNENGLWENRKPPAIGENK